MKQNNIEHINSAEQQVYCADYIQAVLKLGKSKTYQYLAQVYEKQEPFRVIKIGKLFRVPKQSFDDWFYGRTKDAEVVL